MIRQPVSPATEAPLEDRSMRVIEYGMAVVAAIAAVILAFVR
jgi:hypothetical protein